jgi:hypothetical protein
MIHGFTWLLPAAGAAGQLAGWVSAGPGARSFQVSSQDRWIAAPHDLRQESR